MVSDSKTKIFEGSIYLLWFNFATAFEFSCLAKLAEPYLVSGPTYLPQIPRFLTNIITNKTLHMRSDFNLHCQFSHQNYFLLFINH